MLARALVLGLVLWAGCTKERKEAAPRDAKVPRRSDVGAGLEDAPIISEPRAGPHGLCAPFPRSKAEKHLLVEYTVTAQGSVKDVQFRRSSSAAEELQVRRWLESCPFEPAREWGRPIEVRIVQSLP